MFARSMHSVCPSVQCRCWKSHSVSFGYLSFGMMPLTFCDAHFSVVFGSIRGGLFPHVLLKRESPPTLVTIGVPLFRPLI
jgi:hypothetical protein